MVGPDHPDIPIWQADLGALLMWPWTFGGPAVWLFIMLSGFTLYWTEESRRMSSLGATSLWVYAQRRLWRILPTYYVALALGAVVVTGLGSVLLLPSPSLQTYQPVTWGGVLSHLFMVHNLDASWSTQIVPPLWSIAVEMQLYLLFPLLFLLRGRVSVYGAGAGLVAAVFVLNQMSSFPVFGLVEWFVAGAVIAHALRRRSVPVAVAMPAALLALTVGLLRVPAVSGRLEQAVWLVAFASLIAWLFSVEGRRWSPLESKPALWLGQRSYSLYAFHFPVALLCWAVVGRVELSGPALIVAVVVLGLTASLLVSTLSYRWIEVPSLKRSRAAGRSRNVAPPAVAESSPATRSSAQHASTQQRP
jgi:peptidoglycan/LPS O-acetylase OafA/YrhL